MAWINVIDILPKNMQKVLIYNGEIHISTFICSSKDGVEWSEPYYGQEIGQPFERVSYWMELPKKPNKELL